MQIIIQRLTKVIHYKPTKTIIHITQQTKIIITIIIKYYGLTDSIINNKIYYLL